MKVYYDKDFDLSIIQGSKITVVGDGSQGHAQANNLKQGAAIAFAHGFAIHYNQ